MYVAVKGGERAIDNAHRYLADERRGDRSVPEITSEQIDGQLTLAVDRTMAEGSLYDRPLAATAIKQARGDLIEAIFLVRAYRTTMPRFAASVPIDTERMTVKRRISATFKDLPGGQVLGPTFDYTHRLIDTAASADALSPAAEARCGKEPTMPRVLGHARRRRTDRAGRARPSRKRLRRRAGRHHANAARLPGRPRRAIATFGARRRGLSPGARVLDPAWLCADAPLRGRDPARSGRRRHRTAGAGIRDPDRRDRCDGVPDRQSVRGRRRHPAAVHARLRPHLRFRRAQGDGDGAGRPGLAGPRAWRGTWWRRRRTRNSCWPIATTCSRPGSSST